jgi:hypothetical protein
VASVKFQMNSGWEREVSRLKDYTRLKKKVEEDQAEADRAEGALAEIMKRLKDEFDCSTIPKAKKKLKKLKLQAIDIEREYEAKIETYENRGDRE